MPRKNEKGKLSHVDLSGLAEAWEADDTIRRQVLQTGALLHWPEPKKVGLVSLETLELNCAVVKVFMKLYLPQVPEGKTCYIDPVIDQAGP